MHIIRGKGKSCNNSEIGTVQSRLAPNLPAEFGEEYQDGALSIMPAE